MDIRPPEAPKPSNQYAHKELKANVRFNITQQSGFESNKKIARATNFPTGSGLAAKDELRSRLVLGWSSKSMCTPKIESISTLLPAVRLFPPIEPAPLFNEGSRIQQSLIKNRLYDSAGKREHFNNLDEPSIDSIVKGYGEEQFDISDKKEKSNLAFAALNSLWNRSVDESKVIAGSTNYEHSSSRARSRGRPPTGSRTGNDIISSLSPFLTSIASISRPNTNHQSDRAIPPSTPAHLALSHIYYSSASTTEAENILINNENSVLSTVAANSVEPQAENSAINGTPFTAVNSVGIEMLSTVLAAKGGVEFCYLQPSADNCYNFSIRDTVPESIIRNDFVTLGKNGILRATQNGNSEYIPHAAFKREHDNYCKLRQMKIFGKYSLWKPLKAWRCYILLRKRSRVVIIFNSSMLSKYISVLISFFRALRHMFLTQGSSYWIVFIEV